MKAKILPFFIVVLILSFTGHLYSQVQSVNYHIRFNPATCLYDCCIIINEGSATSPLHRAQLNSQFSVVAPAGSTVSIAANHMPLQGNQGYNGTQPLVWNIGSTINSPEIMPESSFISITPTLNPTSFYNNLKKGDTIVLFSLRVLPQLVCGAGLRVFENDVDPGATAPGMQGGEFRNGFTIGGTAPKYRANSPSIHPQNPSITAIDAICSIGLEINLEAESSGAECQEGLSYSWKGPEGFVSNQRNILIPDAGFLNNGIYKVTVTDALGCIDTAEIFAFSKPQAGTDQYVKCYISGTTTINASGVGTWSLAESNSGLATIADSLKNNTTVSGFSQSGLYELIWSANGCSDTLHIQVDNQCDCQISNFINVPAEYNFCGQSTPISLTGNQVEIPGTYLWQYRLNNQTFENATGQNNLKDNVTQNLSAGLHSFRRIYQKSEEPVCADTSNVITLEVLNTAYAGKDIVLQCFETDTAFLNATGTGYWRLAIESAGTVHIPVLGNPLAQLSGFSESGDYFLIWSNGVCEDTTKITVNRYCGCDEANGGNDFQICAGQSSNLQGSCITGVWTALQDNPTGAVLDSTINGSASVHFSKMALGKYYFEFFLPDSLRDTIEISVNPLPMIHAGGDFDYCQGSLPVTIVAGGGTSYLWSTGERTAVIQVSPTETTDYIVTGTNIHGCQQSDTLTVTVRPKPSGTIPPMEPYYETETMTLTAGTWSNGMLYRWQGPSGFESNAKNPVIPSVTMDHAGMYMLTVTSEDDCTSTSSVEIEILEKALPVELADFSGFWNKSVQRNELSWHTQSEKNSDYFELERSLKSSDFETIGIIKAAGNSNIKHSYRYDDVKINFGNEYYYRLKQVDFDGNYSYSNIVVLSTQKSDIPSVHIYPNPTRESVSMVLGDADTGNKKVSIYNYTGKLVFEASFNDVSENENLLRDFLPIHYPPGVYFIKLSTNHQESYHRLVIIK